MLRQEAIFLFQRSRAKWVAFGVRNTHYFHGVMTTKRRKRNTYEAIQDANGVCVANKVYLERLVTNYYSNLFTNDIASSPFCISGAFPKLSS